MSNQPKGADTPDAQAAIEFYRLNPSAALFDFRQRINGPPPGGSTGTSEPATLTEAITALPRCPNAPAWLSDAISRKAVLALLAAPEGAGTSEPDNWQQYAKEGETAQDCIERHRGEQDALMELLKKARTMKVTEEMVSRFLCWKLPEDFAPDAGITFKRVYNETSPFGPMNHEPVGTNLLTAPQARQMLEHVLGAAPAASGLSADARSDQPSNAGAAPEGAGTSEPIPVVEIHSNTWNDTKTGKHYARLVTPPAVAPEPAPVAAQVFVGRHGWQVCPMTHGKGDWLAFLPEGIHDLVLAAPPAVVGARPSPAVVGEPAREPVAWLRIDPCFNEIGLLDAGRALPKGDYKLWLRVESPLVFPDAGERKEPSGHPAGAQAEKPEAAGKE